MLFDFPREKAYFGSLSLESNGNLAGFVETDPAWLTAAQPEAERVRLRLQPAVNGRASEVIWTPPGLVNTIYPAKHDTAYYLIRQSDQQQVRSGWVVLTTQGTFLVPPSTEADAPTAKAAQLDWSAYLVKFRETYAPDPASANHPPEGANRIQFDVLPHYVSHRLLSLTRKSSNQREASSVAVAWQSIVFDRQAQLPMPLDHVLDTTPVCIQYIAQRIGADAGLKTPPATWAANPANFDQFLLNPLGVVWLLPKAEGAVTNLAFHSRFISYDDLYYNGCLLQSSRLQMLGLRAP